MPVSISGSSGITLPDNTSIPSNAITTYLSPGATNTANATTLASGTVVDGTNGLFVNNALVTSSNPFKPTNTAAPVITGSARDTQVLTSSTGTWTNSPTSYSYQWIRGASTNVGTNASTYTCVNADIGNAIKCTVTATNAIGSTPITSSPTANITANTYTISYLLIGAGGGGGGGGNPTGGGGSAGAMTSSSTTATPGTVYTFTIGGGGGGAGYNGAGSAGSGTTGFGTTAGGGGGGGANARQGGNGAGGGGSGASGDIGGAGGPGANSSITGSAVTYAGGGGSGGGGWDGSSASGRGGYGGSGGGGNGGGTFSSGSNGATNSGSGAGAGGLFGGNGATGGSGVVILSVPTASYSGTRTGSPTITTSGANTIIKFTSSGTYTA